MSGEEFRHWEAALDWARTFGHIWCVDADGSWKVTHQSLAVLPIATIQAACDAGHLRTRPE